MSHQEQPSNSPRPRIPSNPPVPPTVLLRNYASTSNIAMSTPRSRTRIPMNPRPYSYTGNEHPAESAFPRARRVSESSPDCEDPSSSAPFPSYTASTSRRRPQPKHLEPRPVSASYAPRKPSPLSCPDPPPTPEPPHVPVQVPIVVAYPPAPISGSTSTTHFPPGPDAKTNGNATQPTPTPRQKRRKLEKRRVEAGTFGSENKARHGSRLSLAGLSSLFSSKKESCSTPNMLLLRHRYTEQYIPPTFDGVRYHKGNHDFEPK